MVQSDFCQKIKISRCRWPGYCGIAHSAPDFGCFRPVSLTFRLSIFCFSNFRLVFGVTLSYFYFRFVSVIFGHFGFIDLPLCVNTSEAPLSCCQVGCRVLPCHVDLEMSPCCVLLLTQSPALICVLVITPISSSDPEQSVAAVISHPGQLLLSQQHNFGKVHPLC